MKKSLVIAVIFSIAASLFAQVTVNPQDEFYTHVELWKAKGLLADVPPIRPFPLNNVIDILTQVIEDGNFKEKELAADEYQRITGKKFSISTDIGFAYKHSHEQPSSDEQKYDDEKQALFVPYLVGDIPFLNSWASFGYQIGIAASNAEYTDFRPYAFNNSDYNAIFDAVDVGPIAAYFDTNTSIAVGKKNLFLQAGIYRTGFGSYINEGLILNDSAYHSGNLSITYMKGRFQYAQQMSVIGATDASTGSIDSLAPGKMTSFHVISYDLFDWLNLGYYESIIYGNRFDISYLAPVPYMTAQGIGGCNDNLQMGVFFDVAAMEGLSWKTDIMVDDFDTQSMLKLNFDSKFRIAAKTGLVFTPKNTFCSRIDFNYTFVTPYTYSHWQYDNDNSASMSPDTISYQNGTNSGIKMGSQLEPNSDAVTFKIFLTPLKNLSLDVRSTFIRHANVCETDSTEEAMTYLMAEKGVYATDGSVYTHSMFADADSNTGTHVDSAWNHMNMFTQDHKMYAIEVGINAKYSFPPTKSGKRFTLKAGVDMEYIHNYGIDNQMFPGQGSDITVNYDSEGKIVDYNFEPLGNNVSAKQIVNYFKDEWEKQLSDKLTTYFNIGLNIKF